MTLRIRDKDGETEFFILSNCDTNNLGATIRDFFIIKIRGFCWNDSTSIDFGKVFSIDFCHTSTIKLFFKLFFCQISAVIINSGVGNPGGNDICLIVLRKNIYIV